jgi:predicted MPP superfamily phosphohydrolase
LFILSISPLHREDFNMFNPNLLNFNFEIFNLNKNGHAEKKESVTGNLSFSSSLDHKLNESKNRDYTIRTGDYFDVTPKNYTYSSNDSKRKQGNLAYRIEISVNLLQAKAEKIIEFNRMYNSGAVKRGRYMGWSAECARRRNDRLYMELKINHPNKRHFDAIRERLHPVFYFGRYGRKRNYI